MNTKQRHIGFTLTEMLVVVGIVALLSVLVIPNTAKMLGSYRFTAAQNLIKTALAQAQAHAAKTQKYAGIRFQQTSKGNQYLILIESNPNVRILQGSPWPNPYPLSERYTPVANAKPTAVPKGVAFIQNDTYYDTDLDDNFKLIERATFSIIFSPTGQLVTKLCQCLPRLPEGIHDVNLVDYENYNLAPPDILGDGIFCNPANAAEDGPPFARDNITDAWNTDSLGNPLVESSVGGVYLCEWGPLINNEIDVNYRYTSYLDRYISNASVERILINIYTGTIIEMGI